MAKFDKPKRATAPRGDSQRSVPAGEAAGAAGAQRLVRAATARRRCFRTASAPDGRLRPAPAPGR